MGRERVEVPERIRVSALLHRSEQPSPGRHAPADHLLEDQPGVSVEHAFRHPFRLEPENVELLVVGEELAEEAGGRERDVRGIDADHPGGPVRMEHGHRPGHEAAPVVPGEDGALEAQGIEQRDQIAGEVLEIVGLHGRGRVAAAVAALVGRDHPEAGGGQGRDLAAPRVGELGEAVAQHHRRAASALVHGQRQARLAGARGAGALGERHPPRRWERLGHQGRSLPRRGARFPHPLVP